MTRRSFLGQVGVAAGAAGMLGTANAPAGPNKSLVAPRQIKAFCIDFNWARVNQPAKAGNAQPAQEVVFFAPPGHWADASPEEHVRWYEGLGANVIQNLRRLLQRLCLVQGWLRAAAAGPRTQFPP